MSTPEERALDAQERLKILRRAADFESLLQHPGWKEIIVEQTKWLEDARRELLMTIPSNPAVAMEKLLRWQLAEKMFELQSIVINDALEMAERIKGEVTLDDALLMEKLRHEQPESTESRSSPTGY